MAHDDRQEIIEVVGEPSGEAADGLHFLRLAKLFFAHAQRVFSPSAFKALVKFAQGPFDGRRQPAQTLLEDIVGGSPLHHVDGKFFALCRGDKKEWEVRVQGPSEAEGGGPVEAGDRSVGKNEAEAFLAEGRQELLTRLDAR
ncbi:MAG: hypothetical protein NTNFB01_33610 [Nitrospira sp.]